MRNHTSQSSWIQDGTLANRRYIIGLLNNSPECLFCDVGVQSGNPDRDVVQYASCVAVRQGSRYKEMGSGPVFSVSNTGVKLPILFHTLQSLAPVRPSFCGC